MKNRRSLISSLLDLIFSGLIIAFIVNPNLIIPEKFGSDFMNMVLLTLFGSLMALTFYYQQSQLIILKGLMFFCKYLSFPSGRKMAAVYATFFFLGAIFSLYRLLFLEG